MLHFQMSEDFYLQVYLSQSLPNIMILEMQLSKSLCIASCELEIKLGFKIIFFFLTHRRGAFSGYIKISQCHRSSLQPYGKLKIDFNVDWEKLPTAYSIL